MTDNKRIRTALISVFYKDQLEPVVRKLHQLGVALYSTGGTQSFIEDLKIPVTAVENLTGYPSILGGRVKTLHPKVFGGILSRRENVSDQKEMKQYELPYIDLVIVDLYPFEETVASGAADEDIIEKIDIGGISLIRAAAKNHDDVLIVSSRHQYNSLLGLLQEKNGETSQADRRAYAAEAFDMSSHYDAAIYRYFAREKEVASLKISEQQGEVLRYGENPHQRGLFYGNFDEMFEKLNGKEISYNNLLDIDAAVCLINDFEETTMAILKHNNACGLASRAELVDAWKDALAGDPVSAFGGVIITNRRIDRVTAAEMDKLFFEVVIAPSYEPEALEILIQKKNRIILVLKKMLLQDQVVRTALNGILVQDRDLKVEQESDLKPATQRKATAEEVEDMLFANKLVKHSKSNTIILAKNRQLLASGVGQTSRVDALKQAITKAGVFGFSLKGAVMASDAFFPFNDCVTIADEAGITAVIQPGGSIRDKDSIEYCNQHNMAMVLTGVRHFKH
ncbi:MAG: bifunctional phosphoribosylaminoimidazolecarboxamide formyltransferase/IMP cyclohydrolase [Bacteroidales bacterium]